MEDLYNLSMPQKAILLTEQFYQGSSVNNIGGGIIVHQALDFELFKKAILNFVKNHDSFRIRLKKVKNDILQYFEEFSEFDIPIVDVKDEAEVAKLEEKIVNEPIDIFGGALFEFIIFRLPNGHGGYVTRMHHLITDAWTSGLLCRRIMQEYSNLLEDENFVSTNVLSYVNYLESEKKYLASSKFEKDKLYWAEKFATIPNVVSIPSTTGISDDFSCEGKRNSFVISTKEMEEISQFCSTHSISIFNFFMSILSIYLSKINDTNDFIIGTPILNRANEKEKNTAGMFINIAPLRICLENRDTFEDLASSIAKDCIGLLRHQKYPYQNILEDLRKQDSSVPNLYNIVLSYQITKANQENEIPYCTQWAFNQCCADDLDIHVYDLDEEKLLNISYDYKTSKYTMADIENLHHRLMYIIEQVLEHENVLLKDIEIVTPEEKQRILVNFNDTETKYPKTKTVIDWFEEQVENNPERIAVVFKNSKLTYRQLNEKANQLAWHLKENGAQSGMIIGICMNRSLELILGLLAILKTGACYLPIDPNYPQERIAYMLEDSSSKLLLTHSSNADKINTSIPKITIDLTSDIYVSYPTNNLNIPCTPEDLVYVIYTSGSTGKPKGVLLKHQNLSNFIVGMKKGIDFSEDKIMVSVTTICFDIFGLELWVSLSSGMKLVIANELEQDNSELLNQLCMKNKVNMIQTTPSRFQNFLETPEHCTFLENMTEILVGGEAFPEALLEKLRNTSNAKIYNMYGPTETTIWSTFKEVTNATKISVGKPMMNTTCYILDKHQKLLPPFAPGELYIGGEGVSNGYLNRNELTAEKFIPSPFKENETIYNTNDLAYFTDDGEIIHLGRTDFQMKLRGYRIELGEIENALNKMKEINSCLVVPDANKKHLICYYISNCEITTNAMISYLLKSLPNYMIPQFFVKLEKFPYTPNGKIDKKALPLPEAPAKSDSYQKPVSLAEKKLKKILEDVLEISPIGTTDNFFELGGDSLAAIKFSTMIYNEFKIQLGIHVIFENPTIVSLASVIENQKQIEAQTIVKCSQKKDFYPTSSAQKRIYYACLQDGKDSVLYNITGGLILDKSPNLEKLNEAFRQLIQNNESLRTFFTLNDTEVVQKIEDDISFEVKKTEMSNATISEITKEFIKPFDLAKAPLIRAQFTPLSDGQYLLLIDMHHIISDGETIELLAKELSDYYNNVEVPEKELDYTDFALWENHYNHSKSEKYWLDVFQDDVPILELPTIYQRPSTQSFEGNSITKSLDVKYVEKINSVCNELNITPYMLLLSAYYILLSQYSRSDDIIIGTPAFGRNNSQVLSIMGMFVNMLPIRCKMDATENFADFVTQVKSNCLQSFEHQDYPYDKLIKKLNLQKDTSRNLLFDVLFSYKGNAYPTIKFNHSKAQFFPLELNISKFDLSLDAILDKETLSLRLEYCTKLFDEKFATDLLTHYINILKVITNNIHINLSDIDMLSKKEKETILANLNNTKTEYETDKTVIDLFEKQVKETPSEIALTYYNTNLTYQQLNEKANQLAYYMKNIYKINHQDRIAILLEKSVESIIAILAITKLGAVFVPIDIEYPEERIDYILKDSDAKLVLTTPEYSALIPDGIAQINIGLKEDLYTQMPTNNPRNSLLPTDLIYIMYTSGSTGKPKGTMIHHRNVVRLVRNTNYVDFSIKPQILQTGSIVFDACTFEIWGSLLNGGTLYLIKKEDMLNQKFFEEYINSKGINTIFLTTALFNQYCETNTTIFSKLRNLLTGGEAVSCKHMQFALTNYPNLNLVHVYGPTENTTFSTYYKVNQIDNNIVPIGKPIANSTAYIVSKTGQIQPVSVPGELWVGGDGVCSGYLNRDDLNQEKFISNPFGNGSVYKTGDLVKLLPDGNIDFVGRIDNQIKIRGFRVELSEIDTVLKNYPNILKVYTRIADKNGNKTILTYFTATKQLNVSDIQNYLQDKLPYYMIPQFMQQLDDFPLTINGKIDKSKLPNIEMTENTNYLPPENEVQEKLCNIWSKLFNIKKIGILDNFFELGGDSLLAIRFQTEAIKQDLNINYSDIFEYQTIKNLSEKKYSSKKYEYYLDENYDYEPIHDLISINHTNNIELEVQPCEVKNLLLFGSTGYLGAHILAEYLDKTAGNIYCVIRKKQNEDAKLRLKSLLNFYFDDKYDSCFDNRINVIYGDITQKNLALNSNEYENLGNIIDTVINSAALVKHYGDLKLFSDINITGTSNIIKFCKKFNIKLYHISTMSVGGISDIENTLKDTDERIVFNERKFYVGQNLNNPYVYTKFEAEKEILEQIPKGLNACILRMGNLFNRYSDAKFQINVSENAFINRIKSIICLKALQSRFMAHSLEFTPVDSAAEAIIKLIHCHNQFNIFNIYNTNLINIANLIEFINNSGYPIDFVSNKEFSDKIREFLKDEKTKSKIAGIIPDLDRNKTLSIISKTLPDGYFTTQYLKFIGFQWPEIDEKYVKQFLKYFNKIGYLESFE